MKYFFLFWKCKVLNEMLCFKLRMPQGCSLMVWRIFSPTSNSDPRNSPGRHRTATWMASGLSSLPLDVSKDRESTSSLGKLCHCFTALIVEKLLYIHSKSPLLVWNHFHLSYHRPCYRLRSPFSCSPPLEGLLLAMLMFVSKEAH